MRARHRNDGLRKLCGCARRTWPKCPHPWHFNFKWADETYRFSLDRVVNHVVRDADGKWQRDRKTLGDRIDSKTAAESERDRLRAAIREGTLQALAADRPQADTLTLAQLLEHYRKNHILVQRSGAIRNVDYQIGVIRRTELERADASRRAFGEWLVADVTTAVIEQFQRVRQQRGIAAANRDLALLAAMFTWAIRQDLVERTPFKKHGEVVIKQSRELHRRRRLHHGERERLLTACGSHLRSVVEAALETGCRLGELLSLQWHQVRFEPRAEIFLPAKKTKTKRDRTIPMSTRLRQMLEMRPRHLPDGTDMPPTGYVFGNELGDPIKGIKRGWERAILKAHGHRPQYVVRVVTDGDRTRRVRTGLLTPECRAALRAIDLHFHDLRREAGSRWLDAGTPLHKIQRWLGHAKVSQTATYLTDAADDDAEAMRRFEARQAELQQIATDSKTGGMNRPPHTTIANTKAENYSVKH